MYSLEGKVAIVTGAGRPLGIGRSIALRLTYEQLRYILVANTIPLGRVETPEDVANLAVFLASGEADFMTGQAINITGGIEMH